MTAVTNSSQMASRSPANQQQYPAPTVEYSPLENGSQAGKHPRQDDEADDDSAKSKKKRSSTGAANTRTGQACDRCKHRKIRCDNTHGGCLPCRQNHTECKTTDRNTNSTRIRGHTEILERDINILAHHNSELVDQLRELGVEPRVPHGFDPARQDHHSQWPPNVVQTPIPVNHQTHRAPQGAQGPVSAPHNTNIFSHPPSNPAPSAPSAPAPAPSLIVHPEELSAGIGGPLSVFGMFVDIDSLVSDASHPARSYQAMLDTMDAAVGGTSEVHAPLPAQPLGQNYIKNYLKSCNVWLPILHGPSIKTLVGKIYDTKYEPSTAETVIVHLALANIMFQIASRNIAGPEREATDRQSDDHYHYALILMPGLFRKANKTLPDIQAMAMLCIHLRCFSNSQAAYEMLSRTLRAAIEIGLHRSIKSLPEKDRPRDEQMTEPEMRKRVFWTLLMMYVPICGKMGQPMPLQPEDFDIEAPELLNDNFFSAESGYAEGKCRIFHAIALMKLSKLYMEMWRTIYAVKRPPNYDQRVNEIEAKLKSWKERDWPSILKPPPDDIGDNSHRVMAVWLHWWSTEFEYLLHHPTRAWTDSSHQLSIQSLEASIKHSSELIQHTVRLYKEKALDTTWGNCVSFLGAIFTLLFCLDKRENQVDTSGLARIRSDIETCLQIIGEIGIMLRSGPRLRDEMKRIVDNIFDRITSRHSQHIASAAVAKATSLKSPSAARALQEHAKHASEHAVNGSGAMRTPHSDYAPASANMFQHRSSSAPQQHPPTHMLSPGSSYQQASNDNVPQYQYDSYNSNSAHYQMPQHDGSNYVYGGQPANHGYGPHGQSAQLDTNGNWGSFNSHPPEDLQSMESATTLMALQQGDTMGGQQQQSPQWQQQMGYPSLMPSGPVHVGGQGRQWPHNTWGGDEGGGE